MEDLKYYVIGHTSQGEINLIGNNLQFIEHIFLLEHESNIITTKIIQSLLDQLTKKYSIEIIASTQGEEYLDGLIIRQLSLAIITKSIDTIHLQKSMIINVNNKQLKNLTEYDKQHNKLKGEAYLHFSHAFKIHEKLEKIFIDKMNFSNANKIKVNLEEILLDNVKHTHKKSIIYKRLFGTNSLDGIVNEVDNLIISLKKRVFLKGRAGTGKSYLMKKIKEKCSSLGLNIEVYLCSLDPNSIDMIIVRDLGFCVLDSTYPHAYESIIDDDIVIDMYEDAVEKGTEADNVKLIEQYKTEYKSQMNKGIKKLKEVKELLNKRELVWSQNLNKNDIKNFRNKILSKIKTLMLV